MLVGEIGKRVLAAPPYRLRIPVKMAMHFGIIYATIRILFETQKADDLIFRKGLGNLQKSSHVFLRDRSVVFRIDEEVIVIQALGKHLLVRERQRPRIFPAQVHDERLRSGKGLALVDVAEEDDMCVKRHRPIFVHELRQVRVVARSIAGNRHQRLLPVWALNHWMRLILNPGRILFNRTQSVMKRTSC